jgi:hypothetical protein
MCPRWTHLCGDRSIRLALQHLERLIRLLQSAQKRPLWWRFVAHPLKWLQAPSGNDMQI